MPKALEKSSQLIDEINMMVGKKPDEERLQAMLYEAGVLERSGFYSDAKQIEGMIAGLRKDPNAVRQKFKAALASSGGSSFFKANFAHALGNAGCYREAVEIVDQVVEECPDSPETLLEALGIHLSAYDVAGCAAILEKLGRLGVADRVQGRLLDKLKAATVALAGVDVSWRDVASRVELVFATITASGAHISFVGDNFYPGEVFVEFGVLGDAEAAICVETLIHKKIASLPFSPVDRLVSFGCFPQ